MSPVLLACRDTTGGAVVLEAPDPRALAHFYSDLPGWEITKEEPDGAAIAPFGRRQVRCGAV
ncbi:VOC family protein [Streptomyces tendae]|uniref:VOC family protein n=1 Tax=Streptomyces tendae TaxID=1932 RepID=UPI0034130B5B